MNAIHAAEAPTTPVIPLSVRRIHSLDADLSLTMPWRRAQAELQALRAENGGYRRKLETTMQRLELAMQQVRKPTAQYCGPPSWSASDRAVQDD